MTPDVPNSKDGREFPAVFVFGSAPPEWLDKLRSGLPEGVPCYLEGDIDLPSDKQRFSPFGTKGELEGDGHPPVPPPDSENRLMGRPPSRAKGVNHRSLFQKLIEIEPGRAWITLRSGLELPDYWYERLLKVADHEKGLGVIQPLSNFHRTASPLPADFHSQTQADPALLDRLVYCLGQRTYFDVGDINLTCAWMAQGAVEALAARSDKDDAYKILRHAAWRSVVLDHLYVHDPEQPLQAPGPESTSKAPHPLAALQRRVGEAISDRQAPLLQAAGLDPAPVLLHVVHSWGGGVERFTQDLIGADTARRHLVLAAAGESDEHSFGQVLRLYAGQQDGPLIREWRLPLPVHSTQAYAPAYAAILKRIVADFAVDQVMVSSLIGHSLEVLETGLPTIIVLHDFYPVCPALNIYFDEVCASCKHDRLSRCLKQNPYNQLFVDKDAAAWLELRDAYVSRILEHKPAFVVPTDSVREHLIRIEPRLEAADFTCIPHGLAQWPDIEMPEAPEAGRRKLRLVLLGRLKTGKGRELLRKALPGLRRYADIWLVGCGKETGAFLGQSGVHLIFDYEWRRLPHILHNIQADAGLLLSMVPETFGYTLSELWSLGLPVIAADRGAYSERVQHEYNGLLIDHEPRALVAAVARLAEQPDLLKKLRRGVGATPVSRMDTMVAGYAQLLPPSPREACRYRLHPPAPDLLVENALRKQLDDARDELESLKAKIEEHRQTLLERASWGFRLQKQVTEQEQELARRAAWAHSLDEELKRTRLHAQGVEQSLNALRHEHKRLLTSRSWRWTAPLRAVTVRLRRQRDYWRFQLGRFGSNSVRTRESLSTRGLRDTVTRIGRERQSTSEPARTDVRTFELPTPGPLTMPASEHPRASIVIPAFNNSALTFACLYSIAAHAGTVPFEVIVVDDASTDDTDVILNDVQGIRVERQTENAGFITACNRGAEIAGAEFLVFLNNDTQVTPGWLEALVGSFDQYPEAGVVGAKLVYPDGRLQEAGGIVFADGSGWNYGRDDQPDKPEYNFVREVDYCSGACIAIGKALFDELGGFDTHYRPAYYEDTDLAFKARRAGKRVLYQPACTVIHFEGATSGTDTARGIKRYQTVNQKKFLSRWRDALATHPAPETDIVLARQHRVKGRVLIVDAVTPQPDHDSGSLRMVNLIQLLQSLNLSVSFIPANLMALEPYTSRLQQRGVEMLHLPWLNSPPTWFAEHGHRFDCVILSRHYVAKNFIWLARRHCPKARILFDTVDLHFLRARRLSELNPTSALSKAAARTRKDELDIARQADTTLVVSPFEQQVLSEEALELDVKVLSNIHHIYGCRKSFAERKDIWFVGGFQHPPNIDAMRWFVAEVWPLIRARLPEAEFHIVGSKLVPEIERLAGKEVHVHGHVPDVEPYLDGCRIAVAPLRYGAGVKGKVNQSMAYGQPVVATPAAVEGMYAEAGQDVLVAETAQDFADAVVRLYKDEALWKKVSENGLENVRRYFSFDAARSALLDILDLDKRTKPSKAERAL